MTINNTLKATDLSLTRNEQILFKDINIQLDSGQALLINGDNGSGKTSLLQIFAGLLLPDQGYISWLGKNIHEYQADYASQLAYVGHWAGLKEQLTVMQNIAYASLFFNPKPDIPHLLAQMNLSHCLNTPVWRLSAGQKKRVALTRLLIYPVNIWILDEPFVGLDKTAIAVMYQLIETHLARGGILLLSSHQAIEIKGFSIQHLRL